MNFSIEGIDDVDDGDSDAPLGAEGRCVWQWRVKS